MGNDLPITGDLLKAIDLMNGFKVNEIFDYIERNGSASELDGELQVNFGSRLMLQERDKPLIQKAVDKIYGGNVWVLTTVEIEPGMFSYIARANFRKNNPNSTEEL